MTLPKHIAIIMDGNRRFGNKIFSDAFEGHRCGVETLRNVVEWCKEFGIRVITVWAFSTENFSRSEEEVKLLFDLLKENLEKIPTDKDVHKDKIRVRIMGRIDLFPKDVQEAMISAMDATKNYSDFELNIAVGYGGQQEILDVAKKLAKLAQEGKLKPEEIDQQKFAENLYVVGLPEPDLIIRTGGVVRTSGFMPWSGHYAEWYFSDKLWPEFEKEDFIRALAEYSERMRRFGK